MQPSNSLITIGVSAVVAASALSASPAAAESGLHRRSASVNQSNPAQAVSDAQSEAQPSVESLTAELPALLSQTAPSQAQVVFSIGQNSSNRLDQLQTEGQIQQQLQQSEFRSYNRSLMTEPNAVPSTIPNTLQLDQQIQQQLDLQNAQQLRNQVGTSPSQALDRLQFEQRVQQQLQQSNQSKSQASTHQQPASTSSRRGERVASRPEQSASKPTATTASAPPSQSSANQGSANQTSAVPSDDTRLDFLKSDPILDRLGLSFLGSSSSKPASLSRPTASRSRTASNSRTTAPASTARTIRKTDIAQAAPEPTPGSSSPAQSTPQSTPQPTPAPSRPAQPTPATGNTPATGTPATGTPATGNTPATGTPATGNTPASSSPFNASPSQTPSSLSIPSPAIPPALPPSNADLTNNNPAPSYLDPDPNPLSFPTQTNEVEVVGTQPITLKQAIELAIRNNPSLQQERLTLEGTQADLRNAQATNLPTLSNVTSFTQSGTETATKQPATISTITGEVANPRAGTTTRNYSDSTALGTGLQLSYNVFTSGRRPALIRAARGQVRLQQLEIERQTEQLILDTTTNYYDLQQASAQVNIFSANLAQAQQSLRDAQALERAGVGTRFDVLQAEVDVSNAQQQLTQQLSQLEIARRTLAQQLNISQATDITAADPIEVAGVWDLSLEETIVQGYKNRVELEQQLIQREIAQQNRRASLAQLGPQVAVNSSFSLNTQDFAFDRIGYQYQVGVSVNTDLFDGGAARAQADRQESNIAVAESQFEQVRDQIRFDIERGYSQLNSSFANIQTTALAVTQATEALRLARLRFQAGVGTQTDVLRQQSVLAQAQVNNLTAILDYNRALATLRRGVSNYPEGLLNETP